MSKYIYLYIYIITAITEKHFSTGYFQSSNIIYNFIEVRISDEILDSNDTLESLLFDCQCVLFLIDLTEKKSLDQIEILFEKINFTNFPYLNLILVQNKIDEEMNISEEEINSFIERNEIKKNMKISIKEGTGIEELVNQIKEYINKKEENIPNNFCSQVINDNYIESKNDNNCKETINIIFLGNSMVGKTSLHLRLNKNFYDENLMSSVGIERKTKNFKYKNDLYKVNLVDTAGQDKFRSSIPSKYYKNADGIFLLFDLCDKESFNDISIWMNEINNNHKHSNENKNGPIIYLIGNKLDKMDRQISREEAEDKASFYGIKYFEISCKLNINISEMYSRLITDCIPNLRDNSNQTSFTVKVEQPKKKKKKKEICC